MARKASRLYLWDEKEQAIEGHYATMPWCAIPFANQSVVDALNELFGVESIPMLIGLNADTGAVVPTRGRHEFAEDPEGLQFPWSDAK
ncbi:hypothetical protein JKF63_00555 [Porcisia hertigi]|uniref:Uncharacterized protein n=1 Tax=Porcisia hertigi TaxID=2761500 RepID=A0A836I8G9_9TRYP|nr:hypothetical protein JKF63_00555 [Porcisia hertigi]